MLMSYIIILASITEVGLYLSTVCTSSCNDHCIYFFFCFFFQAEDGIRDCLLSRGLGDVYKRQVQTTGVSGGTGRESKRSREYPNSGSLP